MCFADPARVESIDGDMATVRHADGAIEVSVLPLRALHRAVNPGDWVLVSLGMAIDIVPACEGEVRFEELRLITRPTQSVRPPGS